MHHTHTNVTSDSARKNRLYSEWEGRLISDIPTHLQKQFLYIAVHDDSETNFYLEIQQRLGAYSEHFGINATNSQELGMKNKSLQIIKQGS